MVCCCLFCFVISDMLSCLCSSHFMSSFAALFACVCGGDAFYLRFSAVVFDTVLVVRRHWFDVSLSSVLLLCVRSVGSSWRIFSLPC